MRRVEIVLAVGLALVAIVVGVVLTRSPLTVAGANAFPAQPQRDGSVYGHASSCEPAGTVPQGTSAIRVPIGANVDPSVGVRVLAGGRLVTQGEQEPGGGINASVTVPVSRVSRTARDAVICITLGRSWELIGIRGTPIHASASGLYKLGGVRLRVEYLRPGSSSWWSRASLIARHLGFGRAASGAGNAYLVIVLMLVAVGFAGRLAIEELE
jgi:hypothetical protein